MAGMKNIQWVTHPDLDVSVKLKWKGFRVSSLQQLHGCSATGLGLVEVLVLSLGKQVR